MRCFCCDCGKFFDFEDTIIRQEYMGEFWGIPAYESYRVCPCCHSDALLTEEDDDYPKEQEEEE